jgi:hypothetical protein
MPQLEVPPPTDGAPYGRPTVENREPERIEAAAMLHDLHGWSLREIAAALHPGKEHQYGSRDVKRGQGRLRSLGVLPWAVFEGAPPADWLYSDEFAAAVDRWRCEAIRWLNTQRPVGSIGELLRIELEVLKAVRNVQVTPWRPPSPES